MENHPSLDEQAAAKELFKQAFRRELAAQGLTVADLPRLLEKQAAGGVATAKVLDALSRVVGAGGAVGAAGITAAPKMLEFFGQWVPLAALGAGALGGTAYAFASSVHGAQAEEHRRKKRKVEKLLRTVATSRRARKKMREAQRKKKIKRLEMESHSGGLTGGY